MNNHLAAAKGETKCDLVIKGGRIANVLSMELEEADIAVHEGIIVGVGKGYSGEVEVDASKRVIIPGLIDGHMHIESTMLSPGAFARAVVPLGTTTVMPDPHEIANTCGFSGIEFMTREGSMTPLDMYFGAPSCVPSSPFETPREKMDDLLMMQCFQRDLCTHLGEMMNYPGILAGDSDAWNRIAAARDVVKTGHMPGLTGRDLCAYLLSGCNSDHECENADEALEKLRRGTWVMIREGSTEHNMKELIKIILEDEARYARCMSVSDDLSPQHLLLCGHMNYNVRMMIELGVRPIVALAMVTINPAQYFRLYDRGAIAPGMIADMVMIDSLENFMVMKVWKRGELVAENGEPLFPAYPSTAITLPKVKAQNIHISEEAISVKAQGSSKIRVIGMMPRQLTTKSLELDPLVKDGHVVSDVENDVLKMVCVEKNTGTGRIGIGFVKGFGLQQGAIASSVAHDAHNFIAVGVDDKSIVTAIEYLIKNQGGLVSTNSDEVLASLPLPIGGIMTEMEVKPLSLELLKINGTVEQMGMRIQHPFMAMSFLSLTVIPELRLTDHGYIDLNNGGIVPLFV